MENEAVWAIDIGGTYTKLGLVTRNGAILKSSKFSTGAGAPFEEFLKKLENESKRLLTAANIRQKIIAVGVGAPNANANTGHIEHAANLRWGDQVPLKESLTRMFDLPVTIANDANASALGELQFGKGRGMENFIVLTLGTGLGSGIISNGQLLVGAHGMAGELGHVNVDPGPSARFCNCGLKGCLETYVSVTGMRRTIFELIAEMTDDSALRSISFEAMTGEIISKAALDGDPIALKAFKMTAETLGVQLADTAAHLDPEAFILLGGLSKAGSILLEPTIAAMEQNLFAAYKNRIKVMISNTSGTSTILGPAALAFG
ncbi:ROK family protein [Pareuzebyella sediminis]|uniref:ROK family protein n=1 Tax=Pareuzebyella sediminis TaxID=2607998 RepID=UPI0018E0FA11|nr:ROK family protein [Pareuzebyella sediminis]